MQNLSASDLLSLELGFQTAREDNDDDASCASGRSGHCQQPNQTSSIQSEAYTTTPTSIDKDNVNASELGPKECQPVERQTSDYNSESIGGDTNHRRMSNTGSARANKWRSNGALRRDGQRRGIHEAPLDSICWLTSEADAKSEEQHRVASNSPASDTRRQQQSTNGHVVETSRGSSQAAIVECQSHHQEESTPLHARRPEIKICVDTCCENLSYDEKEPILRRLSTTSALSSSSLGRPPFAPPPTRANSSGELRSSEIGWQAKEDGDNFWNDSRSKLATSMQSGEQDLLLLTVRPQQDTGSLSDGAYKLTKYCGKARPNDTGVSNNNKRRFEEWKRNNKLITNVHANPYSLHLDCLNELEALSEKQERNRKISVREKTTQTSITPPVVVVEAISPAQLAECEQQQRPNDLTNYANNLTHLYRKNRETMDSSHDFRALLYNIICCLLVQDDQVLGTVSVGKMLDVIRTHLDSASRVYANTSNALLSNLAQQMQQQQEISREINRQKLNDTRCGENHSAGVSSASSSPSMSAETLAALHGCEPKDGLPMTPESLNNYPTAFDSHTSTSAVGLSKSANFRRISSVSYNDEQLIKDLQADDDEFRPEHEVRRSDSLSAACSSANSGHPYSPSPWAYRELSDRRQSVPREKFNESAATGTDTAATATHYTSQSSLEPQTPTMQQSYELTNDSGNGTMCDSQVLSDFPGYSNEARHRRRASMQLTCEQRAASLCCESFGIGLDLPPARGARIELSRRLSDFKPMQQPSYMSTDDYLSTTNNNNNFNSLYNQQTSFYDDDNNSSTLQKCDLAFKQSRQSIDESSGGCDDGGGPLIDVAGRRAELEWTLNKLINIELKLTWLTSKDTLRRAIRKIGVPNEIRGKVWLILIDQMIGTKYDAENLFHLARQTIEEVDEKLVIFDDETQAILKQIELDVNRTMPGHRLFDDGAEGGVKLRRILVAYSIHVNRAIAYCQGFNFIVALLLSVFEGDESRALRGFICIVDHIFPSKYYFDHYLTGARADQFLLADFICDQLIKNPTLAERKMVEGVTSSITLNWFISLFHGAVPTLTRLTILDHFMLEGVKALFRFTMAILYLAFQVTPPSSCEIFTTIRNTAKDMYDIKLLLSIVDQIKLPKDSYFAIRRSFYMVQSSFNSDQFYMQTLSNEAQRSLVANKPLSCQQLPSSTIKPPSLSLISSASFIANATNSICGGGSGLQTANNATRWSSANAGNVASAGVVQCNQFTFKNSVCQDSVCSQKPRTRISADRSKICIQSIGKLGRSHLRIIDVNARANERSLMSPLRNCMLIGISNCGKQLIIARQSSKRNFRTFREQDLTFHIHEISTEIFDGFFLEETQQALVITHPGEIFKIDCRKCAEDNKLARPNYLERCTETLLLRDAGRSSVSSSSSCEYEKVKLRLSTVDTLTNLLWIYVESESYGGHGVEANGSTRQLSSPGENVPKSVLSTSSHRDRSTHANMVPMPKTATKFKFNNPFLEDSYEDPGHTRLEINNNNHFRCTTQLQSDDSDACLKSARGDQHKQATLKKPNYVRKIIIVDIITFDLFSVFAVHPNFGEITNLRASLVAFCQLSNPMSNQFSTRIVQIGPTGRYEQLLSFSDVADYMVSLPNSFKEKYQSRQSEKLGGGRQTDIQTNQQLRYSSLRRFLTHSISFSLSSSRPGANLKSSEFGQPPEDDRSERSGSEAKGNLAANNTPEGGTNTLTRYYRSLMRSYSTSGPEHSISGGNRFQNERSPQSSPVTCDNKKQTRKLIQDGALRSIISSSFGDFSELSETNYIPVNMAFIFRNGKIALFEFTESYAIHTREAQLDRYDYSRVVDVTKNGEDFIVTILTICDKLIKVII